MMRRIVAAVAVLGLMAGLVMPVRAVASVGPAGQLAACAGVSFFGFPSWDACLPKQDGAPVITNLNDVWLIAFPIVESMVRAAGYLSVGFIIFGGYKFMASQGDPGKIAGARTTIQNALIGLVIAILSVTIIRFIADRFTSS